jgi:nucleoside-diphosphate-sugar epimerase
VTILITGATGLIGREFLETVSPDEDAVALAREESTIPGAASRGAVQWLAVDLRDPGFARELPGRADAIVHLAQARAYRDFPEQAVDIFDVNLGATARLLDYARRAGVERFVFASTATMYEPSHTPLTERSPIQCTSYYSASKRAAELLIGQYRELFACRLIRIFTVYGVGQRDQLIANLVRRVAGGEPVTVQGRSGLPVSPIHAADVARVLLRAARPGETSPESGCGVVNVGGSERLGIRDLAEEIGRALGAAPQFAFTGRDDPPGFIADRTVLDRKFPGVESMSFADGIRRVLADGGVATVTR